MDIKQYSLGMPCHKYIARNITTELDMLIYEKEYAKTMLSASFSNSDIETGLLAMTSSIPNGSPIFGKNFDIPSACPQTGDFVQDLLCDGSIPDFSKCTTFYGKYDSSLKACSLCPMSSRFSNINIEQEKAITHYCLLSDDNYRQCIDGGIIATSFHSLFDMSESFQINKPLTIKLPNIIMSALSKPAIRKTQYSLGEGEVCTELKAEIGKRIARYKLPTVLLEKKMQMALINALLEHILKTPLPESPEELSAMISDISNFKTGRIIDVYKMPLKATKRKKKTSDNKFIQTSIMDILPDNLLSSLNEQAVDSDNDATLLSDDIYEQPHNVRVDMITETAAQLSKEQKSVYEDEHKEDVSFHDTPEMQVDAYISNNPVEIDGIPDEQSSDTEKSGEIIEDSIPQSGIVNIEDIDIEIGGPELSEEDIPDIAMYYDETEKPDETSFVEVELPDIDNELNANSDTIDEDASETSSLDNNIDDDSAMNNDNPDNQKNMDTESVYNSVYNKEETHSADNCINAPGKADTKKSISALDTDTIVDSNVNTSVPQTVSSLIADSKIHMLTHTNAKELYKFENAVSKTGYLSLEMVDVDNGLALIMWCQPVQEFFYIDYTDSMANEIISNILTSSKVTKLTYNSHLIYYTAAIHGYNVKNLVDIGMVFFVNNKDVSYPYCPVKSRDIYPQELLNITSYFSVYSKNPVPKDCSIYIKEALLINEAVGYSYANPYIGNTPYIERTGLTTYRFNELDYKRSKPGKILVYHFPDNKDVARQLLVKLAERGLFKKCHIQLIGMTSDKIYLYVVINEVDYITTYIDSIIYDLRLQLELSNLTVNIGTTSVGVS